MVSTIIQNRYRVARENVIRLTGELNNISNTANLSEIFGITNALSIHTNTIKTYESKNSSLKFESFVEMTNLLVTINSRMSGFSGHMYRSTIISHLSNLENRCNDILKGSNKVAKTNPSDNYIEVKNGGVVLKMQSGILTMTVNETFNFEEHHIVRVKEALDNALDVVRLAAKNQAKTIPSSAEI